LQPLFVPLHLPLDFRSGRLRLAQDGPRASGPGLAQSGAGVLSGIFLEVNQAGHRFLMAETREALDLGGGPPKPARFNRCAAVV